VIDIVKLCDYIVITKEVSMPGIASQLVKIGNSQGIRIPKIILEQLDFSNGIELLVLNKQLIVRPKQVPRASWSKQFKQMHNNKDDVLLDSETENVFDQEEWHW
jgi:antitoxin MazE